MTHKKNNCGYTHKLVSEKFGISLTYSVDDIGEGNTIASATAVCAGLTLGTPSIDGLVVEFSVAAGAKDVTYDIKITINTSDGMTFINYVQISVYSD